MMLSRLRILLSLLLLAAISQLSAAPPFPPAPPYAGPIYSQEANNSRTNNLSLITSLAFATDTGPNFLPSTADLLSALATAKNTETTVTVAVAPLRFFSKTRWPWGLKVQGNYASDSKTTTFSLAYRFEWRWIADSCYAGQVDAAFARLSQQHTLQDYFTRTRTADLLPINLLPVPTIGYQLGFFPATAGAADQHSIAREIVTGNLSWRYGTYIELAGTAAGGHERNDVTSGFASTFSTSLSIMFIIPEAFGLTHYDSRGSSSYKATLFQRGLALGVLWSYQRCYESDAAQLNCPKQLAKETMIGAAIDLRVSEKVAPRFTVGRREFTRFSSKTGATEGGLQLVFTIK